MWLTGVAGVLFGIICTVQQVCTESKVIHRTSDSSSSLDEDMRTLINQIHSLSDPKQKSRSSRSDPLPPEGVDLNAYYSVFRKLYVLLQPLMRDGFLEDLPKTLVYVLSGKEDSGLETELIKALSVEIGPKLLAGLSSITTPTCAMLGTDRETHSFFRTYLRFGDSTMATLTGIQDIFVNILTYFPVSGNLVNAVSGLLDTIIKYTLELVFSVLEVPVEYIKIALQFGIRVPSLDEEGKCEHGDLKQLIMWGLRYNVSWSFGSALVDVLLDIFLSPEASLCEHPGPDCPSPSVPFQRSILDSDHVDIYHNILLKCDHRDLAEFSDTVCPDILAHLRKPASASVLIFCQALSSLDSKQIEQVWSNACSVLQDVMFTLTSRLRGDCTSLDTFINPPIENPSIPEQDVPLRKEREASNLNELICNYNSWTESTAVDPMLVSLCGDNQRVEFVRHVCNSATLLKKLASDPTNSWLYAYCGNSTADLAYMVRELCIYEQWMLRSFFIDPYLLEFCMILDKERLLMLTCQSTGFFMFLFSNPANAHLLPNCSHVLPLPAPPDVGVDSVNPCQYSHWHNPSLVQLSIVSQCSKFDERHFNKEVCANQTFLNQLLINVQNQWLHERCARAVLEMASSAKDEFNTTKWCDYSAWASRYVDDSVVGLCWQHDQVAFQKNVCCNLAVFQRLLKDPRNMWLRSVCNETEHIEKAQLIKQVCKYAQWTSPIIVDMTDLAACAWADPDNFISNVCLNIEVFNNLLGNPDNAWLVQYCLNHTNPGANPNGGQGQGDVGFKPTEQCLYLSWSISPPDPALVTLCSEHDRPNFLSAVCPNPSLFSVLSLSNPWLGAMCASAEQPSCPAQDLVKKFNWTCSQDLALACRPGAGQNRVMQVVVRCWLESMRGRMVELLTPEVSAVLDQAVSLTVVSLLSLEEIQNTTYHVTKHIRHKIVSFVDRFFKRETSFVKKRVMLQCFGRVLTSLMHSARDITQDDFPFIQEYFKIPVENLRAVLSESHITTIRMILLYYSRNKNTLQLPQKYLATLTSVLFQTHLATDWSLFPELASLLGLASPADIHGLPLLQSNIHVREIINQNLPLMTLEQRRAFGAWFGIALDPAGIIRGQQSLITDMGNLIAYLPFNIFQHLSAAQLLHGFDVLQRNTLSPIQKEFIAQRVIGTYKDLTPQDFIRLGSITCLADPEDLIVYKGTEAFPVIQDIVKKCTRDGLHLPSFLLSSLLLNSTQTKEPSSLTEEQIKETAYLLPVLGMSYIQKLSPSQLLHTLPVIKSVTFSPAQASVIVEKLSSVLKSHDECVQPDGPVRSVRLDTPRDNGQRHVTSVVTLLTKTTDFSKHVKLNSFGALQDLGSLVVGVKSENFSTMTSEKLLSSLPSMAQQTARFSPAQCNAIATKLWGYSNVSSWLDQVQPLLHCTPLVSVIRRSPQLVNSSKTISKPWNTQQAQTIFHKVLELKPNLVTTAFQSLGTLGQGVTCKVLVERLRANQSPSSVRQVLLFLQQQPTLLHTSLKKCVVDEVYQYEFFPEVLADFGAELVLAIPVSNIKKFTADIMDTVRALIVAKPQHFLLLSRRKQELLVYKIVQKMNMYTGVYTEEEFRSLGTMATFVTDEMFDQLDRSFFMQNMDFLQTLCYSTTKMDIVARMLQETDTFGPVKTWTKATLSQVDRFLFFLPRDRLQEIPQELMTVARIERLFMSQQLWEHGPVGSHCLDTKERWSNFEKQQFGLQFFLGFLKNSVSKRPVPTCEILRSTTASVWTASSLYNMSSSAFVNCLELMGQDPFLSIQHHRQLLQKAKDIFGPVAKFSPSLISQLGRIAVAMTKEELSSLNLTQRDTVAVLGAVDTWTSKQQEILFAAVLNSTKKRVSQLDSSTLVAMGHIVCGCAASEIKNFNSVELSKAVLYLGQLKLKCSEEQLWTMVMLLNNALAFGPTSSWGTNVFIEIGIIAAGLPDMSMSALARHQIEGFGIEAIFHMSPKKFSVVFSPEQLLMFSHEQAEAVPSRVIDALSELQKNALAMVLTPYEDRLVDFRGRSLGQTLVHCPLCLLLGLLMLLLLQS